MTERATINQITQIGVEVTPGTSVPANRLLPALSITPAIQADVTTFRPLGGKYATIAALGKEWVEATIAGDVACYNHLTYLFAGALAFAAPVQQGTTAAYLWTFTPSQTATDIIRTYTVEQGSSARAGRFAYGLIDSLSLTFDREQIAVSGSMLGQAYQDGVTMTGAPTSIVTQPVLPTAFDVFLDPTAAGIGTTRLTRALSGSFDISDRFGPIWTLNSAVPGFAAHVETPPTAQLKLLVAADAAGMGLLTPMRAGDRRYIRLRALGPLIAATHFYTLQIDLCCVVTGVGEFADADGVYAIEWTFDVAFDAAWAGGRALQATLMNILVTL